MADKFVPQQSAPVQEVAKPWNRLPWNQEDYYNNVNAAMYQQQVLDWDFQNQVDLLNYQNAYNSPAEQMARFKEAGLNPNLVYGNGAGSSNMSGSITPSGAKPLPQTHSSRESAFNNLRELAGLFSVLTQVGDTYINFKKMNPEIDLTRETTRQKNIENLRGMLGLKKDQALYNIDIATADYNMRLLANDLAKKNIELFNYDDQIKLAMSLTQSQIDEIKDRISRSNQLTPLEKEKMQEEIYNLRRTGRNLVKQGKLLDKDYQWYDKKSNAEVFNKHFSSVPNALATLIGGDRYIPGVSSPSMLSQTEELLRYGWQGAKWLSTSGYRLYSDTMDQILERIAKETKTVVKSYAQEKANEIKHNAREGVRKVGRSIGHAAGRFAVSQYPQF